MFYIDSSKCTGCGACIDACRQQAISLHNDRAIINQGLYSQCGTCLEMCPVGAIYEVVPIPAAIGRGQPQFLYIQSGKGGGKMRGRGWFGRGFGRGDWGWGRGRGNPYPFCRNFPWLPRRWWATPYTGRYATNIPYSGLAPCL